MQPEIPVLVKANIMRSHVQALFDESNLSVKWLRGMLKSMEEYDTSYAEYIRNHSQKRERSL